MESEEDVVFEGSQLHLHLQSIGVSVETSERSVRRTYGSHDVAKKAEQSLLATLTSPFKSLLQNTFSPWIQLFKVDFNAEPFVDSILKSCLLEEDSGMSLINALETMPKAKKSGVKHSDTEWLNIWSSALGNLLAVPGCCVVVLGALMTLKEKQKHSQHLTELQSLLQNLKAFRRDASSALTLINDHELVQRGFTMSKSSAPGWRLERVQSYRMDMLPQLRESLTSSMFAAVHCFEDVALTLASAQRLLPILNPCDIDASEVDEIMEDNAQDRGTIAQIKFLLTAFTMSESRMLHRLALSYCKQTSLCPDADVPNEVFIQPALLKAALEPLHEKIKQDLKYSRRLDVLLMNKKPEPVKPQTKFLDVYTALHSAALQIQCLFACITAAEEITHIDCSKAENEESDLKKLKSLLDLLSECKKHEENSVSCLIIAERRLMKMMESQTPVVPKLKVLEESDSIADEDQVIEVGRSDYEFKGEVVDVFETESGEGDSLNSYDDDDASYDCHDAARSRRENKEVSRRLHRELISVLHKKAEMYGIREAKALSVISERTENTSEASKSAISSTKTYNGNEEESAVKLKLLASGDKQSPLPELPSRSCAPKNGPAINSDGNDDKKAGNTVGALDATDVMSSIKKVIKARPAKLEETFGDQDDD